MLMPDVTTIIDDPEVGGGQPFVVRRYTCTRTLGKISKEKEDIDLIGNIQPQALSSQSSTVEDTRTESIVIYANFEFRIGSNDGSNVIVQADEILYDGKIYRVTSVNNWAKWGFSIATAERVMDLEEDPEEDPEEESGEGE